MTKAKRFLKSITEGLGKLPVYGWVVYWTLPDIEISRADLEVVVASTLGSSWMPRKPAAKRAVRQASLEGLSADGLLVKVRDDEAVAAFVLAEELVDAANMDVSLEKTGTAVLDKKTGTVRFTGGDQTQLSQRFNSLLDTHNSDDVRTIILNYLKVEGGALTLRDTGGIYFVRNPETVQELERFFTGLGKGTLYAVPIVEAETTRNQMTSVLKDEMERDFVLAAEEVKQMTADGSQTRLATFERRLDDFKALRSKIQMYGDLLKADAQKLDERMKTMEAEVLEALTSQASTHPMAAGFPYRCRVRYFGSAVKKHGDTGTVVGYPKAWPTYVRVLFDKSQQVVDITGQSLEVIR